jgi:hypothetical protein
MKEASNLFIELIDTSLDRLGSRPHERQMIAKAPVPGSIVCSRLWRLYLLAILVPGTLAAQELLRDPAFEESQPNGTFPSSGYWQASWLGESGAICIIDAGRAGNGLFQYTGNPTNDFWSAPYQDTAATPGQAFRGSAWLRTPPDQPWVEGSRARVHVAFLNAATNVLTSFESPALTQPSTESQNFAVVTGVAPPETAFVRFTCLLEKPRGVGGLSIVVFDDCSLEQTARHDVEVATRAVGVPAHVSEVPFGLRNSGNLPLVWRVEENLPWLNIVPTQGSLAAEAVEVLALRVDRAGLAGTNCVNGSVDLAFDGGVLPIQVYVELASPPPPQAPAHVSTYGRQLVVRDRLPDGSLAPPVHYVVKGAAWSPSSRDTPDIFTVRRAEFGKWYIADIQLLRSMNANTVYTFLDFGTDAEGVRVLDNLYQNGLKAVVTVDENGTGDTNRLVEVVTAYRNHPAILAWCIGNEWNINLYHNRFPRTSEGYLAAAAFTESMARMIKALDPNHPVVSTHGDIYPPEMSTLANELCPSVDIWGLNVYRGPSLTTLFEDWASLTDKPMFLSEYGTDAYRTLMFAVDPVLLDIVSVDGAVDEAAQAQWNRGIWREISAQLSALEPNRVCLGGIVFQWNDEWWKAQAAFGGQVGRHDNLGFYLSWNPQGHPDAVANEEWFGQVSVDRHPRTSYFHFQEDFAAVIVPPDSDGDGLPDAWEYDLVNADVLDPIRVINDVHPSDDFDRDGATNLEENVAGTDPTNPDSMLKLAVTPRPATGDLIVSWPVAPAREYELQSCDELAAGNWTALPPSHVISGGVAEFVDSRAPAPGQRFYRLVVMRH